jgi:hypothetical protein
MGASGTVPFEAPTSGVFSYLWQSPEDATAPVALEVELRGDGALVSYYP